ncbi:hypothetical protein GALL_418930 [mine drainage metagenome]|uniref:Uncharacterized protein n=1 Tax=mine drainage metagenome TaxID=410659 RepID=A0A1J5QFY5_9ZZZZ
MHQTGINATNPVAAVGIHRGTVGATGQGLHVNKNATAMWRAGIGVVVKGPDRLHRGVRIGQVHGAAIRAEGHAVGGDKAVKQFHQFAGTGFRMTTFFIAVYAACTGGSGHIHQHGSSQKAALPVAATVVETHAFKCVADAGQALKTEFATGFWQQFKNAAFGSCQPAAGGRAGHAAKHFRGLPVAVRLCCEVVAVQVADGNVDPVKRLLAGDPDRAFADGVADIEHQFSG